MKAMLIDKKQDLEGKEKRFLSRQSAEINAGHDEIDMIPDPSSSIKVIDLPRDPKTHQFMTKDILQQVEQRIKNLIGEQQSVRASFSTLFENVTSAIMIINKDRQIKKINNNFIKLTGFEKADLDIDPSLSNIFVKKDRKKIDCLLKAFEASEADQRAEIISVQCLRKDRTTRYVELNSAKVPGQNLIMLMMNDVTEHKEKEQEILRKNKELTVLNSISRLIKQPKDLEHILIPALEKTRLLLGMDMGAIYLGNQFIKNLQPIVNIGITNENAKKLLDQNLQVIKQIKKEKKDLFLNPSNGNIWEIFGKKPRCRSMALLPLFIRKNTFGILALASKNQIEFDEEKKQLLSAIGRQIAINIENAILFKELEEKTREVEAKNKELSSFVFTVSHDLKTPLIALHGYISLFREEFQDFIDETSKEYLDRIFYNAEHMNKMINDLLKLSRAGRVVGSKRRFSTYKLIKEIYMCLYPQIQQKQIKFQISKNLPIIYGDRQRLQTVFENLIGNAIKYSSEKRQPVIEIDCKDRNTFYEITVADNGIGIDEADHQRIFEVFQKCAKKDEDGNGTGVGLTIVKKIVEHHGGMVWVESKLDKGATFYLTLAKPSSI